MNHKPECNTNRHCAVLHWGPCPEPQECDCGASAKSGPTWKEELYKWWTHNPTNEVKHLIQVQEFISSQIIEKIIEDIPDCTDMNCKLEPSHIRKQLRDKWL